MEWWWEIVSILFLIIVAGVLISVYGTAHTAWECRPMGDGAYLCISKIIPR